MEQCDWCGFATHVPCRNGTAAERCSNYDERDSLIARKRLAEIDAHPERVVRIDLLDPLDDRLIRNDEL